MALCFLVTIVYRIYELEVWPIVLGYSATGYVLGEYLRKYFSETVWPYIREVGFSVMWWVLWLAAGRVATAYYRMLSWYLRGGDLAIL